MSEQPNLFDRIEQEQVEYRDIPGFPGYRVGSDGTVWTSWKPHGGRSPNGSYPGGMIIGDKWRELKQGRRGGNRAWSVQLRRDGRSFPRFVHRLVLEAFVGPRPEGMVARHGPYGKYNNHLYNLSWGTQKQNIADKQRDGTRVFGVRHHNAKLTAEIVKEARERHANGKSILSLAKEHRVSFDSMWSAIRRKTWREVE